MAENGVLRFLGNGSWRLKSRHAIQVLNFESPLPILPCKMPVPNYDVSSVPTLSSGLGPSLMSLTVPC